MEKPLAKPRATVGKFYEATADEKAAVQVIRERKAKAPRVNAVESKAGIKLSLDHPDPLCGQALLMQALSTRDVDFFGELLTQLGRVSAADGKANERRLNFMIAVIKGIEPRDQLETMLAAQMAAIHSLTMEFASRLVNAETVVQQENEERTLNKLARTFAVQMETLKRYRTGGEQRITVQHVSVNDGGHAIVGNVSHRGSGPSKITERPHERLVSISAKPTLFSYVKAYSEALHGTGCEWLDRLPISRSSWWWTETQTQWDVSPWPFHTGKHDRAATTSESAAAMQGHLPSGNHLPPIIVVCRSSLILHVFSPSRQFAQA